MPHVSELWLALIGQTVVRVDELFKFTLSMSSLIREIKERVGFGPNVQINTRKVFCCIL